MCGIFGYTGILDARERLLTGLSHLEYRGYDSCGLCLEVNGEHKIVKTPSRVDNLAKITKTLPKSSCGISHTRWATHGEVNESNAHPFKVGRVTLVHNGIVENYAEIKNRLLNEGVTLSSSTDSEVACGLISSYFSENTHPCVAIFNATKELRGAFAFGMMFEGYEGRIFAFRQKSPLVIARSENGYFLSSDTYAFLPYTNEYYELEEGEICEIRKNEVIIYTHDGIIEPSWSVKEEGVELNTRGNYDTFMEKEINEQGEAISKTIEPRIVDFLPTLTSDKIDESFFTGIKNIHLVGCGSAMHAGLLGAYFFEKYAHLSASTFVASEYRYSSHITAKDTLVIAISQSGETADTLASVNYACGSGLKTLAIVNTRDSQIAKSCDKVIYTYAGIERAVATTKGYTTQVAILYLLSLYLGKIRGKIDTESTKSHIKYLLNSSKMISKALLKSEEIKKIALRIKDEKSLFFMGRGIDYPLCLEGALKLKEISYIHAETYPSGEMKHGTISLIEKGTVVISSICENRLKEKSESNIKEVKSRGAYTIVVSDGCECDEQISIEGESLIERLFFVVTLFQLLALFTAKERENDVDKPRNLAKSVTVE